MQFRFKLVPVAVILTVLIVADCAVGQRVVLPLGTGGLTPTSEWIVLRAPDLAMVTRPSDPSDAAARDCLLAVVAEIRKNERTEQNLLLHSAGVRPEQLRMINAYSADVQVSSEELLSDEAVEKTRDALLGVLTDTGVDAKFVGHERCELFAVAGLALRFEHGTPESRKNLEVFLVPAGERLQYFECGYLVDDSGASAAIESLLRTFDGAKEKKSRVSNLLIGALAGSVAGVLTALFRRRRQMQRTAATGSVATHG